MQKDDVLRLLRNPSLISPAQQTLLLNIAAQAASLSMSCYLVGGCVRDLLLNQPVNDFDILVEGDAIKLGNSLVKKYGGKLTAHQKFHSAIWHLPETLNPSAGSHRPDDFSGRQRLIPDTVDLITARAETYERPGALPTVKPSTIDEDLRRRDFTINAMAIRLDGERFGEFLDPLNGESDLKNKIIHILHPNSFMDDPTRIFRAIRYEQRYTFNFQPLTLKLINLESLAVLEKLSGERLRHEIDLIFEEKDFAQIIQRAGNLGLFHKIDPKLPTFNPDVAEFLDMDSILDIPTSRASIGYMLWLMNLSEDEILSIAKRLDFSTHLTHSVWVVSQLKKSLPFLVNSKPSVWTLALEKLPPLSIYVVYRVSREQALLDYLSTWRHVKPNITGDDLKDRGLQPGPRFGEILSQLRAAWLDGDVTDGEQELDLLNRLLASD